MRVPANLIMDRATGEFLRGSRERIPPYDDVTEVLVVADSWPPDTGERWDGATGLRPPTQTELDEKLTKEREIATEQALMDIGVNAVLLRVIFDIEKRLRALGADPSGIGPLANAQTLGELKQLIAERYGR